MITAEIDTSKAEDAVASLYDAMLGRGMDASNVIRDETRLLAKTIVAFIPPGKAGKAGGEKRIEKELKNLISEASPMLIDEVGAKYGIHDVQQAYIEGKNGPLQLNWKNLDATGNRLAEYHKKYRRDGRIPFERYRQGVWQARVVAPTGSRSDYIRKIQQRVGRAKAAWAFVAAKLGENFPNWITRHFSSLGSTTEANLTRAYDPTRPEIIFGSRALGVEKFRSQIQAAVNARAKAIARKVRLILSDYKTDIAQGYRAQAKARKYREAGPPIA